jgi:kynurenine 3-monooxygenase
MKITSTNPALQLLPRSFSSSTLLLLLLLLLLVPPSSCFLFLSNHHDHVDQRSFSQLASAAAASSSLPESNDNSYYLLDKVAIVGAGPSGLLLAHRLLHDHVAKHVTIYESRNDPRELDIEGRAYALGLGMRGRTALQSVDGALWNAVKQRGFDCERFTLYVGPLAIKLRDKTKQATEPSVLMYQTDLCAAMLDELDRRHNNNKNNNNRLSIHFQQRVMKCNVATRELQLGGGGNNHNNPTTTTMVGPFDLIVGCDGVNSVVRQSLVTTFADILKVEQRVLPGEYKVVRLHNRPPKVDPNTVALLFPKAGTTTAFVEPTANDGSCVLFATNSNQSSIVHCDGDATNVTALEEDLLHSFPRLDGCNLTDVALQLIQTKLARASSVVCNVYHAASSQGEGGVALVGDAAHATGGVSGQGVNSALVDASVLANCLKQQQQQQQQASTSPSDAPPTTNQIGAALLRYSQLQVPEGKALYDLSFGPKPSSGWKRVQNTLRQIRDTIFQGRLGVGRPPLQTMMTTSLTSFADLRRRLDYYYDAEFPTQERWNALLQELDEKLQDRIK